MARPVHIPKCRLNTNTLTKPQLHTLGHYLILILKNVCLYCDPNHFLIILTHTFRPDDTGGSLFGLTDQYRRVTKFGVSLSKLTNSKYYRANLYWTDNGRVSLAFLLILLWLTAKYNYFAIDWYALFLLW